MVRSIIRTVSSNGSPNWKMTMAPIRHVRLASWMHGFVNELAAKTAWLRAIVKREEGARQSESHMVSQSEWRIGDTRVWS